VLSVLKFLLFYVAGAKGECREIALFLQNLPWVPIHPVAGIQFGVLLWTSWAQGKYKHSYPSIKIVVYIYVLNTERCNINYGVG